jgi:acyl carrier protein
MLNLDSVVLVVFEAIDEINPTLQGKLAKSPDTVLFGKGGSLDSIGLVILVVTLEQLLEERFGVALTLADERAVSQKSSPFRTVRTLAEYVHAQLGESARRG